MVRVWNEPGVGKTAEAVKNRMWKDLHAHGLDVAVAGFSCMYI